MITIKGDKKLINNLGDFKVNLGEAIDKAVMIVALSVQVEAQQLIKQPSNGKKIKRKKGTHIQSIEGEAPNTDGGRLIKSIKTVGVKGKQRAFVGTNVEYAPILELVYNRPFLEPALEKKEKLFDATIKKVVEFEIKKAGKT
jgi:phage gpG-like protein